MIDNLEVIVFTGLAVVCAPIAMFLLYALFWLAPSDMANEAACLAKGYPKTSTDWKGNGYCMNLEGTVTVKLEALK